MRILVRLRLRRMKLIPSSHSGTCMRNASTDRPAARDHRRAHGLGADSKSHDDLDERHSTRIELNGILSHHLRQLRAPRCQARLTSHLPRDAAVHVESGRKLPDGHTARASNIAGAAPLWSAP